MAHRLVLDPGDSILVPLKHRRYNPIRVKVDGMDSFIQVSK